MAYKNLLNDKVNHLQNRNPYKALGYSDDDMERPVIGIANSWNTLVPGHFSLNMLADYVKRGIYRGGGTAVEFGTIAVCDQTGQGHDGMHFSLPSREIIANSVETMAQAHNLAALVLLGSCDKIVPGMLMAAVRLDIPCILLPAGPMLGGMRFDGRKSDFTSVSEAQGMYSVGAITQDQFYALEEGCSGTCGGSCSFYGTANSMCAISEALGMTIPGGAMTPAYHPDRLRLAVKTGEAICELVRKEVTARKIVTKKALENAIRYCLTSSASTNSVMHLTAIAYEAELNVDVMKMFEELNKKTPVVARVYPSCNAEMNDLFEAGGVPRVQKAIAPLLNLDAMTCTSKTLKENLDEYRFRYPENRDCITDMEHPFAPTGGLAVLRGNLAPDTAITKPGAIDPSVHHFKGEAICFNSEEEANDAILAGKVKPGMVVVIRYEGPKGGPGMREMYTSMKLLHGQALDKCTALITDGRFSGTNNGCFVGHISPEAASGGTLAVVEDGDTIEIDVNDGTLELLVPEEEIKARLAKWTPRPHKFKRGYLAVYSKMVSSAAEGSIIRYE